jgi:hypothetical protein
VGLKSISDVTATDMGNCLPIYPLSLTVLLYVFLLIHPEMCADIDDVAVANKVYPKDTQLGLNLAI